MFVPQGVAADGDRVCLCRRVSLLTVIGLWTLLSVKLLVLAQRLERSVADVIHALNQHLVSTHSLTH